MTSARIVPNGICNKCQPGEVKHQHKRQQTHVADFDDPPNSRHRLTGTLNERKVHDIEQDRCGGDPVNTIDQPSQGIGTHSPEFGELVSKQSPLDFQLLLSLSQLAVVNLVRVGKEVRRFVDSVARRRIRRSEGVSECLVGDDVADLTAGPRARGEVGRGWKHDWDAHRTRCKVSRLRLIVNGVIGVPILLRLMGSPDGSVQSHCLACDRIEIGLKCCAGIGWSWGSSIAVARHTRAVFLGNVIVASGRSHVAVVEVRHVVVLTNLMTAMRGVDIVLAANVAFLSRHRAAVGTELMVDLRRQALGAIAGRHRSNVVVNRRVALRVVLLEGSRAIASVNRPSVAVSREVALRDGVVESSRRRNHSAVDRSGVISNVASMGGRADKIGARSEACLRSLSWGCSGIVRGSIARETWDWRRQSAHEHRRTRKK